MTETDAQKVERLAEAAAAKAGRRPFTVTKFGKHEDGYLHARVTPSGGKTIYVHCRFGSWMAPGTVRKQAMFKELEALMGPELGREAKTELARMARSFKRAEKGGRDGNTDDSGTEPAGSGEGDV